MNDEQKAFLECYKVAADFCGKSNSGKERSQYNYIDFHKIAREIAENIGVIKIK